MYAIMAGRGGAVVFAHAHDRVEEVVDLLGPHVGQTLVDGAAELLPAQARMAWLGAEDAGAADEV